MKIGYIRISTEDQNTARQEVLLHDLGVTRFSSTRPAARMPIGQNSPI